MTKREDQQICMNAPVHSTALVQVFYISKHHITQVYQHLYSPDLAPREFCPSPGARDYAVIYLTGRVVFGLLFVGG